MLTRLNESPSEKEGKSLCNAGTSTRCRYASMKALPKRKGNDECPDDELRLSSLNESPSEKEGK